MLLTAIEGVPVHACALCVQRCQTIKLFLVKFGLTGQCRAYTLGVSRKSAKLLLRKLSLIFVLIFLRNNSVLADINMRKPLSGEIVCSESGKLFAQVLRIRCHDRHTAAVVPSSRIGGMADIAEVQISVLLQEVGVLQDQIFQCALRPAGESDQIILPRRRGNLLLLRRLLNNQMAVGAAEAEGIDARTPTLFSRLPRGRLIDNIDRRIHKVNVLIRLFKIDARRQNAVLQSKCDLQQTRTAGRGDQMPDIGLYRTNAAELLLIGLLRKGVC